MNDGVRIGRSDSFMLTALGMGLMAASFYISAVLAFFFLIPIQLAFGRLGSRGGLVASGVAAIVFALAQVWRLLSGGNPLVLATWATMAYPLVLLAALLLLNGPFWKATAAAVRILVVSGLLAALISPLVALLATDARLETALAENMGKVVGSLLGPSATKAGSAVEGYDSAALLASLDAREIVRSTLSFFASSYAALLFLLIGGSWWVGNRLAGEGSAGRRESPALAEIRMPEPFIWPFLFAWALVFAAEASGAGRLPKAVAWNLSLLFSLAYAAQGSGIIAHLLARWKAPRALKVAFVLALVMAVISPPLGTALVAILPLLGVTEQWIPYRNPKGVGA